MSTAFERLCQRAVLYTYGDTYRFVEEPGNWWDGSGHEIDLVAPTNGSTLLVGEAKFKQSKMGYDVFSQLQDEAQLIDWTPDDGQNPEYEFALFSRSGFSQSLEEAATKRDTLRLFTVDEVVRL